MPTLVVERGAAAREDQQRLRAGHHERHHQGHARRQEDGLLRGGRGRARPRRLAAQRGYSGAKAALAKSQYETRKVFLPREGAVPADCTVLVVAGPEKDLLPPAVEAIRALREGRRQGAADAGARAARTSHAVAGRAGRRVEPRRSGRDVVVDSSRRGPDGGRRAAHAGGAELSVPRDHQGPARGHDRLPHRAQRAGRHRGRRREWWPRTWPRRSRRPGPRPTSRSRTQVAVRRGQGQARARCRWPRWPR